MSKRPKTAKQSESEQYVLPEIEIISQPEANRKLLLGDQKPTKPNVGVSPTEVLPAVGKDAKVAVKGYRISDIQQALHNAGFNIGSIDGKMGPKTKKAIQEFQKENNLTIDGIVGKKTWAALKAYLEQPEKSTEN
jgi:peptidoglycan hydrolase-like protein with peptidoglycan-binding domain